MSLLDTYRQRLNAQIQEHKVQLDALKAKAKRFAAESRVVGRAELAIAEKQLGQVKSRLNELKGTGGDALEEIKSGVKKALADLQVSTRKAARHFKNGPAAAKPRATAQSSKRRAGAKARKGAAAKRK